MAQLWFSRSRDELRLACLAVAALTLLPGAMRAQQPVTLTGKVTSEQGTPLASAGVIIEQLGAGAVTRPDGTYTILIPGARVPSGPVQSPLGSGQSEQRLGRAGFQSGR
jgi:hypothetical protein